MATKRVTQNEEPTIEGPRYQQYMPLLDLLNRRDPRNAKLHDDEGIKASMERHGYIEPVVLDERTGLLISGHGRVERLEALRGTEQEPPDGIVVLDDGQWYVPVDRGWSSADDDEAETALIGLNQLTSNGGWDINRLHGSLSRLAALPSALAGVGFTAKDIERLKRQIENTQLPATGAADESEQLAAHWSILIECKDEAQQKELLQRLIEEGVTCKALLL